MELPLLSQSETEWKAASDASTMVTLQPVEAQASMEHLGLFLRVLRIAGLWRPNTPGYQLKAVLHGLIIGLWCGGWLCYRIEALIREPEDDSNNDGFLLAIPFVVVGPLLTWYFSWFMCVLESPMIQPEPGSRLLAIPNTSGRFADVLQISKASDVTKWGKYACIFVSVISGPCSVSAVLINWAVDTRPGMLTVPAYWAIITNIFATIPLYLVGASVLSCIALSILLIRERLLKQAKNAEDVVELILKQPNHPLRRGTCATSVHVPGKGTSTGSLDVLVRDRYGIALMIESVSKRLSTLLVPIIIFGGGAAFALLYTTLKRRPLVIAGSILGALVLALVVVSLLGIMAALHPAGEELLNRMLKLRSRWPCQGEKNWDEEFSPLRNDIDSIISHCSRTPIGFELLGMKVTPNLVQSVLSILSTGVATMISDNKQS